MSHLDAPYFMGKMMLSALTACRYDSALPMSAAHCSSWQTNWTSAGISVLRISFMRQF